MNKAAHLMSCKAVANILNEATEDQRNKCVKVGVLMCQVNNPSEAFRIFTQHNLLSYPDPLVIEFLVELIKDDPWYRGFVEVVVSDLASTIEGHKAFALDSDIESVVEVGKFLAEVLPILTRPLIQQL